jgi:hypothetical protein
MRRNGFDAMKACGRVNAGPIERRRQEDRVAPVDAFSTMDLEAVNIALAGEWSSYSPVNYADNWGNESRCTGGR